MPFICLNCFQQLNMQLVIFVAFFVGAICAQKEEDMGSKVAVALEKYAEYMVIPENQDLLLEKVEEEVEKENHREIESEQNTQGTSDNSPVFNYMVTEMGSAKGMLAISAQYG